MKFNDSSNKEVSLYHHTLFLLGLANDDTTSYPVDAEFTRAANKWLRKVSTWIWQSSGTWEYDDRNETDYPIATTTLVDGQQDYTLPSTVHKIDRVEVKDNAGNFRQLIPLDKTQINTALSEFQETDGLPRFYDLVGYSLFLYPAPASGSVTTSSGLKIYFSRGIHVFETTDTTAVPGFDDLFHDLISTGAAIEYCIRNNMDEKKKMLDEELQIGIRDLQEHYGNRHRDMSLRIRVRANQARVYK